MLQDVFIFHIITIHHKSKLIMMFKLMPFKHVFYFHIGNFITILLFLFDMELFFNITLWIDIKYNKFEVNK